MRAVAEENLAAAQQIDQTQRDDLRNLAIVAHVGECLPVEVCVFVTGRKTTPQHVSPPDPRRRVRHVTDFARIRITLACPCTPAETYGTRVSASSS